LALRQSVIFQSEKETHKNRNMTRHDATRQGEDRTDRFVSTKLRGRAEGREAILSR